MLFKLFFKESVQNIRELKNIQRNFALLVNSKYFYNPDQINMSFDSPSGMPGSGAGKGGGAGGSVRESGGRLGEYGAAQEEHYFFNKQKEQLEKIKKKLKSDKPGEMTQKEEK